MQPIALNTSKPTLIKRVILLASFAALVTLNTLSSMGILGPSQADVSGKYSTSLVPAGIWAVIFTLQGAGSLFALLETGYQMPDKCAAVNAVAIGWPVTWLFETAWLLTFPRQTTATFYISAVLLFCGLAAIGSTAGCTHAVTAAPEVHKPHQLVWALFVLPTSMNAAWMSVASCLGLDVLAVSQGLPHDNEVALAATLAVIVATVGACVVVLYRDVPWGLVLIWAFVAVIRAHPHLLLIRVLSVVAIGVAGLCSGYVAVRHWQNRHMARSAAAAEGAVVQPLLGGAQGEAGPSGQA